LGRGKNDLERLENNNRHDEDDDYDDDDDEDDEDEDDLLPSNCHSCILASYLLSSEDGLNGLAILLIGWL
jgi:hypothetical protein